MSESDVDDIEESDDPPELDEFDHYTTALLFGGPPRVVQIALYLLDEQRRIRLFRGTRRIEVLLRERPDPEREEDPVREAVIDEIPDAGLRLGELIAAASRSPEVRAVGQALREEGLVRGRRFRLTRDGREVCRYLVEELGDSQLERLAVLGPAGLATSKMRSILLTDDPKPAAYGWSRLRDHTPGGRGRYIHGMSDLLDDNSGGYSGGGDYGG
ncbi:TIGR04222 domain-containing membrane protein, partial [Actinomadura sp. GC306]|uniref:TIGR04222 domain-containing membrane protein n=1 Tax=Actinomadura sp. GC306 TaxID=2530367 RepID=UPI0010489B9C